MRRDCHIAQNQRKHPSRQDFVRIRLSRSCISRISWLTFPIFRFCLRHLLACGPIYGYPYAAARRIGFVDGCEMSESAGFPNL
jgi:hypothetical protein